MKHRVEAARPRTSCSLLFVGVSLVALGAPRAALGQAPRSPAASGSAALPAAPPGVCVPGKQEACACAGGTSGVQRCNATGTGLEPCECPPEPPPPPARADAGVATPGAPAGAVMAPPAQPPPAAVPPAKKKRPGVGLIIGGSVLLGVTYLTTALGAGIAAGVGEAVEAGGTPKCTDSVGFGLIPLIGPFLIASGYPNYQKVDSQGATAACADFTAPVVGLTTVSGLLQLGGAAMLGAGVGVAVRGSKDDTSAMRFDVGPMPGGLGLTLRWRSF